MVIGGGGGEKSKSPIQAFKVRSGSQEAQGKGFRSQIEGMLWVECMLESFMPVPHKRRDEPDSYQNMSSPSIQG